MAQLEKSTITVPTAVIVIIGVANLVMQFMATRYAVQLENEKMNSRIELEAERRQSEDKLLDQKIANNTKAIEAVNTRVDALRPSTVTTFR